MWIESTQSDGWMLTPERAIIHVGERVAVIADAHLGYEWARGRGGDMIPAHSLREFVTHIGRLLRRAEISRLVVAGDLVESTRACVHTRDDVGKVRNWLTERGVALEVVAGNHDPRWLVTRYEPLPVAGWSIAHGHGRLPARPRILGHCHPALRLQGASAACFLVSETQVILPAFSRNCAGVSIFEPTIQVLLDSGTRCIVPAGDQLLDFGRVAELAVRGQRGARRASGARVRPH